MAVALNLIFGGQWLLWLGLIAIWLMSLPHGLMNKNTL